MSLFATGLAGRLARIALGAAVMTLAGAEIASAQYYPPGPPPGYYRQSPPPGYPSYREDQYRRQQRGYYDEGYQRPRRARMGSICGTSRGSCQQPVYTPVGSRCFCIIPGFGKKFGVVQY